MREPTKEVQVDMSFKGHNFTTFIARKHKKDFTTCKVFFMFS